MERVTLARIERKPTPTPSPTPPPIHAISPVRSNSVPTTAPVVVPQPAGKAAHKETIKHLGANRVKPPKTLNTKPIWDTVAPTPGQGAGAGKGAGAGSLGEGTQGSGTGSTGTGAGGGGAPCGAVDFSARGPAVYNAKTGFFERSNVTAIVHYADGSSESVPLDWTWRFKTEEFDPFNPSSSAPMFFQFPPVAQRASEPPAVQYIMQNSKAYGGTKLNADCPNIPPPPTAHP
ncbi:MAG: hypothetical protein KGN02_05850 [bacterium]|nr:hypothetical protein [bacterium]